MAEDSNLVEKLEREKKFFSLFNDLQTVYPDICYECFDVVEATINREMNTDYTLDEVRGYLDKEEEEIEYKYLKMES